MQFQILAVGDVVAEGGLRHLEKNLRPLKKLKDIAFTVVNGENAAQIMIMAGCDLSEDPLFPDWRENLHLALRLQQKGDLLYPGLFRPLFFAQRNYNMHATHGSLLVEVGTEVNTQREADYAGELLGETILAVLNDIAEE